MLKPHPARSEPHEAGGGLQQDDAAVDDELRRAAAPPPPRAIARALASISGSPLLAWSRQGRPVQGVVVEGEGPALVITAGQHANETTGIVGALRAARRLQAEGAAFAVIPLENPDGYALHRDLCVHNPSHMHHAARYTAMGDDLEYRTDPPFLEKTCRLEAARLTSAILHVNLHGYPAHEWTRPLTGYVPHGFPGWSIPKGFHLILRYRPGWLECGRALLERVTADLAKNRAMMALTAAQQAAYRTHSGALPEPVLNGIVCVIQEKEGLLTPLQLITEYPDETIGGPAFRLAHTVQYDAVLAARAFLAEAVADGSATLAATAEA